MTLDGGGPRGYGDAAAPAPERPRFVLPPVPPPYRRIRRRRRLRLAALVAAVLLTLGTLVAWAVGDPALGRHPAPATAARPVGSVAAAPPSLAPAPPPALLSAAPAPPVPARAATLAEVPALLRADPAAVPPVLGLTAGLAGAAARSGPARERALAALIPTLADPALPAPLVAAVRESAATYLQSGQVTGLLAELTRAPGPRADAAVAFLRTLPGQSAGAQAVAARALLSALPAWSRSRALRPDLAAALTALVAPVAEGRVHL